MSPSAEGPGRARAAGPAPATVHAAVDRLVLEHGAYRPIDLLVDQGRLDPSDLAAWRGRTLRVLEDALLGNPGRIRALLGEAARWAARLGLEAEAEPEEHLEPRSEPALARDPELGRLLATRYVRRAESPQPDLFLDAGESLPLGALREALATGQAGAAVLALEALLRRNPDHRLRPAAERLCDALAHLEAGHPVADPAAAIDSLRGRLAEDAREVLGARRRHFLAALWRRVAETVRDQPFDAANPERHPSFAFAQYEAWDEVAASIHASPVHGTEPVLLERLAEAEWRRGARAAALRALSALCWGFPAEAERALDAEGCPDPRARRAWEAFQDLPFEPPLDVSWLPAWLLLEEPGLAKGAAGAPPTGAGPAGAAFAALRGLLAEPRRADDPDELALRQRLRDAHPGLLERYLRRREGRGSTGRPG